MINVFEISDFEEEVLNALGITYKDGFLYCDNTGCCFKHVGIRKDAIKEIDRSREILYHLYKGSDGWIAFIRSEKDLYNPLPTLFMNFEDVTITITSVDATNINCDEDKKEKAQELLKGIKKLVIEITSKQGKKCQTRILFNPSMESGKVDMICETILYCLYKRDFTENGQLKSCGRIDGIMDGIVNMVDSPVRTMEKLDVEAYSGLLKNAIEIVYKESPSIVEYYLRLVPLFAKAFERTLCLPALNENNYRRRYESMRKSAQDVYDLEVSNAQTTYSMAMSDASCREKALEAVLRENPIDFGAYK